MDQEKNTINFLFDELLTGGATLSAHELAQKTGANIIATFDNEELEKYFKIKRTGLSARNPGIDITFTPKLKGDYAYIRTKDGRWLNHEEPIIAVSNFIKEWLESNGKEVAVVIGNGTRDCFKNLNIERDIDVLLCGNYEDNKNIDETIREAKKIGNKIVWFGRYTKQFEGVENISSPKLEDIPILYNRAKTFISMSKCEGFSRPIAEATACGFEVLNYNGGNRDVEVVSWDTIGKELLNFLYDN